MNVRSDEAAARRHGLKRAARWVGIALLVVSPLTHVVCGLIGWDSFAFEIALVGVCVFSSGEVVRPEWTPPTR